MSTSIPAKYSTKLLVIGICIAIILVALAVFFITMCHDGRCSFGKAMVVSCSCYWTSSSCGAGGCPTGQKLQTKICNPTGCQLKQTKCVEDSSCLPHNLSLSKFGNGYGTVISNPVGISCPLFCVQADATFGGTTTVTLTAAPANGYVFSGWGWGGTCSGSSTVCRIPMNKDQFAIANFNTPPCACSSWVSGNCGTSGTSVCPAGQRLQSRNCTGTNCTTRQCIIDANCNSVNPTHNLSLSKFGNGEGTVTSSPAGIACKSYCYQTSANFSATTTVILTEAPAIGYVFSGWNGACSGSGKTCQISMSVDQTVIANFNKANSTSTATSTATSTIR